MIDTLDVNTLPGMPAPFWFVQFFKVLGFVLHMVPMHLWFAGLILAAVMMRRKDDTPAVRWGKRLVSTMPILIAFGVNFGIVPLLFIQVAYPWAFYPATILTAWFWMAIIALLIPAYYGVYAYAFGVRSEQGPKTWQTVAGWIAALLFVVIGVLFANGWSLMASPASWKSLWLSHEIGGAATGTAHFLTHPGVWARWLLMFGLALITTGAWTMIDAGIFAPKEDEAYRRWAPGFALKLAAVGFVWFAVAGSWYVFGTWPKEIASTMWSAPWIVFTILAAATPILPLAVLIVRRGKPADVVGALAVFGTQVVALASNGIARQIVQNLEIAPLAEVWKQQTAVQWSPLVAFLAAFVFGACVVAWLLRQVLTAASAPAEEQA